MPRPIAATISLPSLRHNLEIVMAQLEKTGIAHGRAMPNVWAVVKANAYGHGIEHAVRAFSKAQGLAMLDLSEAIRCREAGWKGPLMLLEGFFEPADIAVASQYDLLVTIHCAEQLAMLLAAKPVRPLDIIMKLNTGMNRLGFSPGDYREAYARAQQAQAQGLVRHLGKMTHFARADDCNDTTSRQLYEFSRVTEGLPGSVSVCNSAATLTEGLWTRLPADELQWMRPGICLYGATPFASKSAMALGLLPAQTLSAELISVRTIAAGMSIGYGHIYTSPGPMRIGVVSCGYADGYPRHAPSGTPISVDGVPTQTLGRVSMDMLVVDLTPVPQAGVGSRVVLWGQGGPSVDDVAHASQTIGYELLCGITPRVPRYLQE